MTPNKPKDIAEDIMKNLGPLAFLVGMWEGGKGDDTAPSDNRGVEENKYREQMKFEAISPVNNHEQALYGLRYSTTAWRLGEKDPFHEDMGYFLWDPKTKHVLKCFVIPRGIALIAGGAVDPHSKNFKLSAKVGSHNYGICSNIFLDGEFKTEAFELNIVYHDKNSFSYEQDTQIKIKGKSDIFHHIDKNTLMRMK